MSFDVKLTQLQAFNAMRKFLEDYFYKSSSDDVGALLGAMQFFPEGGTYDPAMWEDWIEYTDAHQNMTPLQVYNAMLKFLDFYIGNSESVQIQAFLRDLQLLPEGGTKDSAIWEFWVQCLKSEMS